MNKTYLLIPILLFLTTLLQSCASQGESSGPTFGFTPEIIDDRLTDIIWELSVVEKQAVRTTEKPFIRFGTDGKFSGSGGCNNYLGTYEIHPQQSLYVIALSSTRKACTNLKNPEEWEYIRRLRSAGGYDFKDGRLRILGAAKQVLLEFTSK